MNFSSELYYLKTNRYSDLQKHESSCLLSDRFWCISPEPFEQHKISLPLLGSILKELSDIKGIFQIGAKHLPDLGENTDFSKKK